jgi:uncharacterized membrane protein YgdD (TMEM256/DUF423 family)
MEGNPRENGRVETYETAVRYQLYHAMALFVVGLLMRSSLSVQLTWAGRLFLAGPLLFSGSLFALSLSSVKWVVYVTPVGGMLMIAGWLMLLLHFLSSRE